MNTEEERQSMSDEVEYAPSPCRCLFGDGKWQVPVEQRTADWRERIEPKTVEAGRKKAPRRFAHGRMRFGECAEGRARGQITLPEIKSRRVDAGVTAQEPVVDPQCHPPLLWRRPQRAAVKITTAVCVDCGEPTGKAPQALRCGPCGKIAEAA